MRPSLGPGYDYDVTNEEVLLNRLSVRDGQLVLPGGMSYEILALPDREGIDAAALRKIEQFVREGATVSGPRPQRATGYLDFARRDAEVQSLAAKLWGKCDGSVPCSHPYGKGKVISGQPLRAAMRRGPDFAYSASAGLELDYIHRSAEGAEIYFVRNRSKEWGEAEVTFRVSGKQPEIWNPGIGEMRDYPAYSATSGGTQIPMQFVPEGSLFVVFRKASQPSALVANASRQSDGFPPIDWAEGVAFRSGDHKLTQANGTSRTVHVSALPAQLEVAGPWNVSFTAGLGAPANATFPKLISWTDSPDSGIRYYSGIAEYTTEIRIGSDWLGTNRRVYLDLGSLWAAAQVEVNGQDAGTLWKVPYRAEISSMLHEGTNQLRIRVANDWANRLIGDARDPGGKHYTKTNIVRTTVKGLPWEKVEPIDRAYSVLSSCGLQ